MTTSLILDLPVEAEQFIKTQAASQEKSPEEFVLQAIGFHIAATVPEEQYEYTTDDFNEETLESIREMEANRDTKKQYSNADEMMADILGKGWQNA